MLSDTDEYVAVIDDDDDHDDDNDNGDDNMSSSRVLRIFRPPTHHKIIQQHFAVNISHVCFLSFLMTLCTINL